MDEEAFQQWMEETIPVLTCLSLTQTKNFFQTFLGQCSLTQKMFFEREMQTLIAKDIMVLPKLVIDRILGFLDLHQLLCFRLVCRFWRRVVTDRKWLWRRLCLQNGAKVTQHCCLSDTCYFHLFMSVRRILKDMTGGKAFEIRRDLVHHDDVCEINKSCCKQIAYNCGIIAVEYVGRLLVVDARTKDTLCTYNGLVSSFLLISNNVILSGTFLGQLRVLSLDGSFEHQIQIGVNQIVFCDVHVSGQFLISCFQDGSVRLLDNKIDIFTVHVKSPSTLVSQTVKVLFLPDNATPMGQLSICVCRVNSFSVALITETGHVLQQKDYFFQCPVETFCQNRSDHSFLHCHLQSGLESFDPSQFPRSSIESFHLCCDSSGISIQQISAHNVCETGTSFGQSRHLLAVGMEFTVMAEGDDLVIRRTCGTVVCILDHFFEGQNVPRLLLARGLGAMTAVNISWTDGFSPSTSSADDTPVVLTGIMSCIKSVHWSPQLWEDFRNLEPCQGIYHLKEGSGFCVHTASPDTGSLSKDGLLRTKASDQTQCSVCVDEHRISKDKVCEKKIARYGIWNSILLFQETVRENSQYSSSLT